jgi:hypothetical protein
MVMEDGHHCQGHLPCTCMHTHTVQ